MVTERGTFYQGAFYLTCGDGNTDAERVECGIYRGSSYDVSAPLTDKLTDEVNLVATFKNYSLNADTYGRLRFEPMYTFDNVPGVYTGTVHFWFSVVNE
jgi:hypothetical protein